MSVVMQDEWAAWSDKLWDAMEARIGYPGLAHFEQVVLRSHKEQRCARCGDSGMVEQTSGLIKRVKTYWLCQECHDHYV